MYTITPKRFVRNLLGTAFFLLLFAPVSLFAQGTITGTVIDAATGEPLPAANVLIEGTNLGASTNAEGNYTIQNVPAGNYTLKTSFIGYKTESKTVQVTAGTTITVDFQLEMSILNMDELVVTATGIRRKVEIGNAIARIDVVDDVKERPVFDIMDVLQGQAAGVQVFESGGSIGMGARIRVRGSNSASLSNEPVIYIDGVLINNTPNSISYETGGQAPSRLNDINPEDIESIEIIKGPSAATLYGSIAANGVIRITTKRGKAGRPRWSAFMETGMVYDVGKYPANYQALDANGQPCFTFQAAEGLCTQATIKSFQPLTDPRTSPFRTGLGSGSGLSVSGGNDRLTYFLSGSLTNKEGVLPINSLRQTNLRGNFAAQVTNALRVSLSTSYLKSNLKLPLNDNFALGLMGQGLNGRPSPDINDGWGEFTPEQLFTIDSRQDIDRFTTGLEVNWNPHNSFSLRVAGGLDYTSRWDNQFFPTGKAPAFLNYDKGARFSNRFSEYVYTLDIVGSYTRKLSENITSRTSAGFQYLQNLIQGTLSTGLQLVAGSSSIAGAAITFSDEVTTEQRTVGLFLEEQLVYRDRLFLTGAIRADRGSAFGAALDAVIYPKVSLSWLLSDEPFFKTDWITSLRLRGAWGASGVPAGHQ
ncbi:MAG: TonB-dependent receptor [candidate division KSB1 bacterium]|nr:TonB-dependent receptor [candidate division KSB1 bacterium]